MPAFVGGDVDIAGIKWVASFPGNINRGIPRAHSVVVLNNADTGEIEAIINTNLISIIRTVSVTGLMIEYFDRSMSLSNFNLGIVGWGPIGQFHFKMVTELYGSKLGEVFLYDKNPINPKSFGDEKNITITESWEQAYSKSDVFITCTVADEPYIDKKPKKGSLLLNISLRDYKTDIYDYIKDSIIVDDWQEVCRENTDIERLHIEKGLKEEMTHSIVDVVIHKCLAELEPPVIFNPMGMGVFDMGIGSYYFKKAVALGLGQSL